MNGIVRLVTFFTAISTFGLVVSLIAVSTYGIIDPLTLTIRLLALNGYLALSVAAIMTPFLKEITLFFKKSFANVHHYFAAAGLLLITLHPIAFLMQAMIPSVLLPNFSSLFLFFYTGGLIALVLIYVALGAGLLRKRIMTYWRPFHVLMYLALFIGIVHANYRGIDFVNSPIAGIYDGLFAAVLAAFVLKRWQFFRARARIRKVKPMQKTEPPS